VIVQGDERGWSGENPHAIRSHDQHRQFSIDLWAENLVDCLIGSHILPSRVCGRDCLKFLQTHLSGLLEDVSFNTRLHMLFRHDCAAPHYSREARQ
jgi:hypothetical protein